MSYKQCLSNALNEGTINKKQFDEQSELIENLERTYKGQGLNPTEASIEAAKRAYDTAKVAAAYKKRNNRLKIAAQQRIDFNIKTYLMPKIVNIGKNYFIVKKVYLESLKVMSLLVATNIPVVYFLNNYLFVCYFLHQNLHQPFFQQYP